MLLATCCFAIALIAKQNYLIFLIAGILYWVGKSLQKPNWKHLIGICLLLAMMAPVSVEKYYEEVSGISFSSGIPSMAYVTMGLQEGPIANGWYNQYNSDIYQKTAGDLEKMKYQTAEDLKERIQTFFEDPYYALDFFKEKISTQWNEPIFQSLWNSSRLGWFSAELSPIIYSLYYGRMNRLIVCWLNLFVMTIWLGNILYMFFDRKKQDLENWIFTLCFLGGFLFHLFWEAKALYAFPYYVVLIPNAVIGLCSLLEWVEALNKKRGIRRKIKID